MRSSDLKMKKRYDIINRIYVTTVLRAKYVLTDTPKHKFRRDIIMAEKTVRTRYAPSPTGFMHVGNLRTALYEYLVAKSQNGKFVLRIEDTDRERLVEGAVDVIYDTMKLAGLKHDEGPDIGGDFGPYVQSERKDMYLPYAEQLIKEGKAYRCFCTKERLEKLQDSVGGGYDRHCRNLPQAEIDRLLAEGTPYVIRQKMPIEGSTTFTDAVFGEITVDNSELQDQILIKTDGYPTYNFANVIDDHTMGITHVVRGCEYLSSTPKYNLLYEAFGWEIPTYITFRSLWARMPTAMFQSFQSVTAQQASMTLLTRATSHRQLSTILHFSAGVQRIIRKSLPLQNLKKSLM